MRRAWIPILVLAPALAIAGVSGRPGTTPPQGMRPNDPTLRAFTGARIVISPDRVIERGTLLVRDGRVVGAGVDLTPPPGAFEYDLDGRTIYPGFIDPYTDYGLAGAARNPAPDPPRAAPRYTGDRTGGNAWNEAIHADRDWVELFQPDREAAEVFLARGVTVVQSGRMDGIFRGRAFVVSLADGPANQTVLRPHAAHFVSFDKGSSRQAYPESLMGSIALLRQTLSDARWYTAAHAAYRRNGRQPAPEFNRDLASVAAIGGQVVFETTDERSLLRAARIAREFSLPTVHVGSNREYRRIEQVRAVGGPIVLPLGFPALPEVASYEDGLDVSLAALRHWERAASNASVLADHGLEIAFTARGLDEKQDFLSNLRKTVDRGLDRRTALAALTTVPAALCGVSAQTGSLDEGKLANFFIADGDILDADTRILSVWIGGALAHELQPLDATDFRGTFRVELDGKRLNLNIEGELPDLSGKLGPGKKNGSELAAVRTTRDRLQFQAELRAPGAGQGTARFTVIDLDGRLIGRALLPDGRLVPFEIRRTAAWTGDDAADEAESDEGDDDAIVSRLTFPNVGFGSEALPRAEDVLVRGATVWTAGPAGRLEDADLLIVDGRVAAVGRRLEPPPGATVIDGRGKHLTPGLIDEHSHLAISGGVNEGSHAVTSEVRIGDVVNPDDIGIYRALSGGVTTVQLLHGSANPIGGQAQVIKLRWGLPAEELKFAGAPPTIKFALGENVKQSNWGDHNVTRYPQSRMGVETILRDSFHAAREYERTWREYRDLAADRRPDAVPPRRDLQLEALLEILRGERFVHCHSYTQAEILMLMRLAEGLGFRIQTFTHILEGYKVADEMAAHGATASTFSDWWAYKFEVYDAIPYNTCLMQERGVLTSVNSDSAEMVRRLNQEAGKSVLYCGMDASDALRLVTLNPAIQLRIDDRVGSLEPGKDGDFVIWNGHPLSVYSRVEQTWLDGRRYFDREEDARRRLADRGERRALEQKVLASSGPEGDPEENQPAKTWHCEDVDDAWREQSGR